MISLWRCRAREKLTNIGQHEAIKVRSRVVDGSTRSTSTSYCFSADDLMCTSKGMRHSAYIVCDRSIIDCDIILRLYLCVYHNHSLQGYRWWSCWHAQRTTTSVSKRWIHRVHDQLLRTGKHTMACTLRSLRFHGTITVSYTHLRAHET